MYTMNRVAMAALISLFQLGQGLAGPAPSPEIITLDRPAIATKMAEYLDNVLNDQDASSVKSVLATALPSSLRARLPVHADYMSDSWYTGLDDKAKRWGDSVNSELAYLATGGDLTLTASTFSVSTSITSPVLLVGTSTTILTQVTIVTSCPTTSVGIVEPTTIVIGISALDRQVEQSIAATHNGAARETGLPRAMVGAMGVIGAGAAAMMML